MSSHGLVVSELHGDFQPSTKLVPLLFLFEKLFQSRTSQFVQRIKVVRLNIALRAVSAICVLDMPELSTLSSQPFQLRPFVPDESMPAL